MTLFLADAQSVPQIANQVPSGLIGIAIIVLALFAVFLPLMLALGTSRLVVEIFAFLFWIAGIVIGFAGFTFGLFGALIFSSLSASCWTISLLLGIAAFLDRAAERRARKAEKRQRVALPIAPRQSPRLEPSSQPAAYYPPPGSYDNEPR